GDARNKDVTNWTYRDSDDNWFLVVLGYGVLSSIMLGAHRLPRLLNKFSGFKQNGITRIIVSQIWSSHAMLSRILLAKHRLSIPRRQVKELTL
ncbi:hypothetical protein, partial [Staphylococcus felis]|uniref:hypothetical protein n=1 Tax=Staphylococcus felis TaxID=46127 RepID=UPI0019D45B3E